MKKTLSLLVPLFVLAVSFLFNPLPSYAAHGEIDHYRSVHQYMSMHMIDPDKTGPEFLYTDASTIQPDTQLEDSVSFVSQQMMSGVGLGILGMISLFAVWYYGRHSHSAVHKVILTRTLHSS